MSDEFPTPAEQQIKRTVDAFQDRLTTLALRRARSEGRPAMWLRHVGEAAYDILMSNSLGGTLAGMMDEPDTPNPPNY